jgi:hypothetical protein
MSRVLSSLPLLPLLGHCGFAMFLEDLVLGHRKNLCEISLR